MISIFNEKVADGRTGVPGLPQTNLKIVGKMLKKKRDFEKEKRRKRGDVPHFNKNK